MKLNSPRALELGRRLFDHYGDWAAVLAAGVERADGIIEIAVPPMAANPQDGTTERPGTVPGMNQNPPKQGS